MADYRSALPDPLPDPLIDPTAAELAMVEASKVTFYRESAAFSRATIEIVVLNEPCNKRVLFSVRAPSRNYLAKNPFSRR